MSPRILCKRCRLTVSGLFVGVLLVAPSVAQYPVNYPQPTGRLLDSNPQVGAVRFYESGPISPLLGGNLPWSGNLAATGNLRGGLSLRTFSPISDTSTFRGPLGSAGLSNFVRDSIGIADSMTPLGALPGQAYFDPARTAPTAAWLNAPQNSFVARSAAFSGPGRNSRANVPGLTAAQPLDLRVDTTLPNSAPKVYDNPLAPTGMQGTLFSPRDPLQTIGSAQTYSAGGVRPPTNAGLRDPRVPTDAELSGPAVANSRVGPLPIDQRQNVLPVGTPSETRLSATPIVPTATAARRDDPMSQLFEPDSSRLVELRRDRNFGQPATADAADKTGAASGTRAAPPGLTGTPAGLPAQHAANMLTPGRDVFTDMQMSIALERDPSAAWYAQMQTEVQQSQTLSIRAREVAGLQAQQFVERALNLPIVTLAGEGSDALNTNMRNAESLLDVGKYYEAARAYEQARLQDPTNPLPVLGKGHALLAAGEYLTAAALLAQGFERFPELSKFKFDARELLGSAEVIDIRRADLLRRLESREDPQLRFLLGYLEYFGGRPGDGLSNLRKAAERAPSGSLMWRFPEMLEGRGVLPPPKLPSGAGSPPQP